MSIVVKDMPVYSSNPQGYMSFLDGLYSKTFQKKAKFLTNDTFITHNDPFITHAIKIVHQKGLANYPGSRIRLLPKAAELLQNKDTFDAQVGTGNVRMEALYAYIKAHTQFARDFEREVNVLLKDTPYMYQTKYYRKTVVFMKKVFKEAFQSLNHEAQLQWKEELAHADYVFFERLTDLCLLKLIENPTTTLPEFFQSQKEAISQLNITYPQVSQTLLKLKLMGSDAEIDETTRAFYRSIGMMRANLQKEAKTWATLMHTMQLSLAEMVAS